MLPSQRLFNYREEADDSRSGWGCVWGWVKQRMGLQEGTCRDEPWVTYGMAEPLRGTPERMVTYRFPPLQLKENLPERKE